MRAMKTDSRSFALGYAMIFLFWFLLGAFLRDLGLLLLPRSVLDSPLWRFISLHLNFIALSAGLLLVIRYLHSMSLQELIREREPVRFPRIWGGMLVYLALLILGALFQFILTGSGIRLTYDTAGFFTLLPAVLILTPLQTTAEELVFRAYLAKWMKSLQVPLVITSIISGFLFLGLHLLNPEVSAYPGDRFLFIYYFAFGFSMMFIGQLDGGFEFPIGIHAANNLFAVLILNYRSTAIPSSPVFEAERPSPFLATTTLLLATIIIWLFIRRRVK
jgi:membrane protease YdiL (CAAX protease family)